MSHSTQSSVSQPPPSSGTREAVIGGLVLFAAVMLTLDGILSVFRGIMAIADDNIFVSTRDYVFEFNLTGWGVLHVVIGGLAVIVGLSLFTGAIWARMAGILLAGFNLIVNFLSLPYYPFWSIVLMVVDALVIWALAVYRQPSRYLS